ncbi:TonB-dependent receptor [Novosphingobium flavum]|uniref:TonB-dependent receptor n=1 Tax=Novosphingobium aerophilum TaxID=2839843 RepID=A0A7X1F6G6_9SPHN|nr:TonB-dependent receptor [Novosphingobium aerophilum]
MASPAHTGIRPNVLLASVSALALAIPGSAWAEDVGSAPAARSDQIEEIVVTAQRRTESLQKVPMTIQAYSGAALAKYNIATFEDVRRITPNVAFSNNGPGQGEIFIRGLSAGGAGTQGSGSIGTFPNVAVYLDDQSMQFPGRNADIFMADMERVEVLEGPQGTLFGGGAQAGAIRYITNKPQFGGLSGSIDASYGLTTGGAPNTSLSATFNVPIIADKLAVRAVVYNDRRGGYIDNVYSTFTRSNNDLGNYTLGIRPNNTGLCPNGLAPGRAGYCTVGNAPQINNSSVAAKDQNPVTYQGVRLSALYQIDEDWNALVTQSFQHMDAQGVFFETPTGADFQPLQRMQTTTFSPAYNIDKFSNTALTINGKIDQLKVVYTGSYMVRNVSQQMDYTNYSRAPYGVYYQCTGGTNYAFGAGKPATCYAPTANWQDTVRNTHLTNELRISSPSEWRLRFIVGGFVEQFKIYDAMNFNYKTIPSCNPANLASALAGGATCLANLRPNPASTVYFGGVRGDNTAFGQDIQRGYDQLAVFGSFDFDIIPNKLTVTAGGRYFRYTQRQTGSVFSSFDGCVNVANGNCTPGNNLDAKNLRSVYTGFRGRANVTYQVTPDTMLYYTFSEGFRPGGFNRSSNQRARLNGVFQFATPLTYEPDNLTNHEIGLKTSLFDRKLILNLTAYYMIWDSVQFGLFNPAVGFNYAFTMNGPSYHNKGIEAQFTAKLAPGLTLSGAGAYNRNRQSNSPCLINNNPASPGVGKCITQFTSQGVTAPFANPFGQVGGVGAFSPEFQGSLQGRYEWMVGSNLAHIAVGMTHVGKMFNQPSSYTSGAGVLIPTSTLLRYEQPAYTTFDLSVGLTRDNWRAEVFVSNLTNSQASTFTSAAQYIKMQTPLRPRVISFKVGTSF